MATEEIVEATNGVAEDIAEVAFDVLSELAGVTEQVTQEAKKDSPAKRAASNPTPAAKSTPEAKKCAAKDKKDEVTEDTKEDALEEDKEVTKVTIEDTLEEVTEDTKEDALEEVTKDRKEDAYRCALEVNEEDTLQEVTEDTKEDALEEVSEDTKEDVLEEEDTNEDAVDEEVTEDTKEDAVEEEVTEDTKEDALEEVTEDTKEDALEQEPMDSGTAATPELEEEGPAATEKKEPEPEKKAKSADHDPPKDEELPEFDPNKFKPGYVPKTVKKGEDEYNIIVSGVKDTGLCGGYWGNIDGKRRRSKPPETLQLGKNERRGSVGSVSSDKGKDSPALAKKGASTPATDTPKANKKQVTKTEVKVVEEAKTPMGRGRKRKTEVDVSTPGVSEKKAKKEAEDEAKEDSKDSFLTSRQQLAVAQALTAGVPGGQQRTVSCVTDTDTQREVVVECFAPYDDHRWVNIGKERDGMAPDAVQYSRALRPPYHLLSFLKIKGHSNKGMSCTDRNTMVFVVLEGEITVILHTTQFNAKKGDSFYIPPKNYYNLINQKAREAELSLIQFQYDGPLPTVQPSN